MHFLKDLGSTLRECDYDCLERPHGMSDEDFILAESVHFLKFHRWWTDEELLQVLDSPGTLREVLKIPFSCHPILAQGSALYQRFVTMVKANK